MRVRAAVALEPPAESGFTMLELLVVMLLMALVFGVALPRIGGSIANTNLKTAAKQIAAALRYARTQAVAQQKTYVAVFDFEKQVLRLESGEAVPPAEEGAAEAETGDRRDYLYALPAGVFLEKAFFEGEEVDSETFTIIFVPSGSSSGGELVLVNERERRLMVVVDFITGTVRLAAAEEAA